MKRYKMKRWLGCLFATMAAMTAASAQDINKEWVENNYTKTEVMIPMRDGVRLYTAIYEPKDKSTAEPILITRTPYKASPYGKDMDGKLWNSWSNYAREHYILVVQDVRGRWKSEGNFVNIRPFIKNKKHKTDIDEASDVYDTTTWLLKKVKGNNGKVGLIGCSYPGFYALMGGLSGHPAIKAIVPEAPVTDWFMGDDFHHNGTFLVDDAFGFNANNNRPRPHPIEHWPSPAPTFSEGDDYSFFLKAGCINNLSKLMGDSIQFWTDMMNHPNYDAWWQARDTRRACYNVKPAVLIVGGLFDAEDYFGARQLYQAISTQSPQTNLQWAVGPWSHGAWNGSNGSYLGHVRFGANTIPYYKNDIVFPFLQYYLKGIGEPTATSDKVRMFFSGENKWRHFDTWPPREATDVTFYLHNDNTLSQEKPVERESVSTYQSDPTHPVPYTAEITNDRTKEYMTDDQRFAETRPDVLTFKTAPLTEDMTLCGDIEVRLRTAISTTDADFVVKVIDQFPDDFAYDDNVDGKGNGKKYLMNGYEMLVRGDIMRGRYRNSFEKPEAFDPNRTTSVNFKMQSIAHTFKKGHRVCVQIQSSWFPLADRNPQQFVDIYHCSDKDFVKSDISILHQADAASCISVKQLR